MPKFEKDQKVKFVHEHGDRKTREESGEIVEVITEGAYAGQYRVHIGWLTVVQPEDVLSAA